MCPARGHTCEVTMPVKLMHAACGVLRLLPARGRSNDEGQYRRFQYVAKTRIEDSFHARLSQIWRFNLSILCLHFNSAF